MEKAPTFQWGVKRPAPPACPVRHVPAAPAFTLPPTPAAQELRAVVHAASLQAGYVPLLLCYCLLSTYCCFKKDASALTQWLSWLECHPVHQKVTGSIPGLPRLRVQSPGGVCVRGSRSIFLSPSLPL